MSIIVPVGYGVFAVAGTRSIPATAKNVPEGAVGGAVDLAEWRPNRR